MIADLVQRGFRSCEMCSGARSSASTPSGVTINAFSLQQTLNYSLIVLDPNPANYTVKSDLLILRKYVEHICVSLVMLPRQVGAEAPAEFDEPV